MKKMNEKKYLKKQRETHRQHEGERSQHEKYFRTISGEK